jgi:hypothetical protein
MTCIVHYHLYGFDISFEELMFFLLAPMLPFSGDLCYIIISVSYHARLQPRNTGSHRGDKRFECKLY